LLGKTFYVGATLFEEGLIAGPILKDSGNAYQPLPPTWTGWYRISVPASNPRRADKCPGNVKKKTAMVQREAERAPLQADAGKIQVLDQVQQESISRLREDLDLPKRKSSACAVSGKNSARSIDQTRHALQREETLLTTLGWRAKRRSRIHQRAGY